MTIIIYKILKFMYILIYRLFSQLIKSDEYYHVVTRKYVLWPNQGPYVSEG